MVVVGFDTQVDVFELLGLPRKLDGLLFGLTTFVTSSFGLNFLGKGGFESKGVLLIVRVREGEGGRGVIVVYTNDMAVSLVGKVSKGGRLISGGGCR